MAQFIISRAYETIGILKDTGRDLSRGNRYDEEKANNFCKYDDTAF